MTNHNKASIWDGQSTNHGTCRS